MAAKSKLSAAIASLTKNVIGAGTTAPATVQLPQAVHEIHVSPDDVIAPGTIITRDIAELAGLATEEIERLIKNGAMKLVEVFTHLIDGNGAEA